MVVPAKYSALSFSKLLLTLAVGFSFACGGEAPKSEVPNKDPLPNTGESPGESDSGALALFESSEGVKSENGHFWLMVEWLSLIHI